MDVVSLVIPALRMQRQVNLWGSPTSQTYLVSELQTNEEPVSKKKL